MKKWSLLLIVMLIIASITITVHAATVPDNVEWIELGSKEDFLEWFGNTTNSKNLTENYTAGMTRYYKLTDDITIDQNSTVYYLSSSANQVNTYIDLNGHTLTYASPKETDATRLFGSYNDKTTTTVVNGTIENKSNITGASGGLFFMNKGKLYMEDVVINDKADAAYTNSGKVIISEEGSVALSGATVIDALDLTSGVTASVGMLTENALIAVRAGINAAFTEADAADYADFFKSADPGKTVSVENGALILVETPATRKKNNTLFLVV